MSDISNSDGLNQWGTIKRGGYELRNIYKEIGKSGARKDYRRFVLLVISSSHLPFSLFLVFNNMCSVYKIKYIKVNISLK